MWKILMVEAYSETSVVQQNSIHCQALPAEQMNEMNLKAKALKINTDVGIISSLCKRQGRFTLGVFCIALLFIPPGRSMQAITGMNCSWHLSGDVLCHTPPPLSLMLAPPSEAAMISRWMCCAEASSVSGSASRLLPCTHELRATAEEN